MRLGSEAIERQLGGSHHTVKDYVATGEVTPFDVAGTLPAQGRAARTHQSCLFRLNFS